MLFRSGEHVAEQLVCDGLHVLVLRDDLQDVQGHPPQTQIVFLQAVQDRAQMLLDRLFVVCGSRDQRLQGNVFGVHVFVLEKPSQDGDPHLLERLGAVHAHDNLDSLVEDAVDCIRGNVVPGPDVSLLGKVHRQRGENRREILLQLSLVCYQLQELENLHLKKWVVDPIHIIFGAVLSADFLEQPHDFFHRRKEEVLQGRLNPDDFGCQVNRAHQNPVGLFVEEIFDIGHQLVDELWLLLNDPDAWRSVKTERYATAWEGPYTPSSPSS